MLANGTLLNNRYQIIGLLGQGGMSSVYRAQDRTMNRYVAIKEQIPDPNAAPQGLAQSRAQFQREAQILGGLSHPSLPHTYDYFSFGGNEYVVMELIEGQSLQQAVEQNGAINEGAVRAWADQILDALTYIHERNIIHRDIKPANIIVKPDGRVVLVDFGLVKLIDPNNPYTATAMRGMGTAAYAPLEQFSLGMHTDARSDIYAFGATLYHLLAGHPPLDVPQRLIDPRHQPALRTINPRISSQTESVVQKAMEVQPQNRWQTAVEMRQALSVRVTSQPTAPVYTAPIQPKLSAYTPPIATATKQANRTGVACLWTVGTIIVGMIIVGTIILFTTNQFLSRPTPAPTAAPPTAAPTATARQSPSSSSILSSKKVGLVTDVGGVNDKSFNQSAWTGVQKAAKEFGWDAKFIESKQPTDYEKNIDQFATSGYDVIVTVGFLMGDATALKAKQYPRIKFGIIDNAYYPTRGVAYCDDTKKDCYVDGGLTNVTSLMFQEDQVGFLAGVLAGGMTRTGTVCTVSGMEIPPVVRYVVGYQNGAKWIKADVKAFNVYIPSFVDPAKGKETAQAMIAQGCDVIFGVGGNTGNGGLLAAKEKGLMAIGVDVDQYLTYPEVASALISSAQKNVDVAVYNYLKSIADGSVKAGVNTANVKNGGVGLAPFHEWDNKIPQTVKDKLNAALSGLKAGSIRTGY